MRKIQMVDLGAQYEHIQKEVDEAVLAVIRSSAYINGPEVKSFTEEFSNYLGAHVIPCANGTDALQLALMALDLKPGDEVIVPSFTFVASAEVIALMGLVPIFADVTEDTFLMDLGQLDDLVTEKTKAIIPVHLFGQCVDMHQLMDWANERGIYVIEDNAQAIGSTCQVNGSAEKSGTIGHIGTTSFFPSKNLGCYGDGGAVMTRDEKLAHQIKVVANHGSSKRYYHETVGVNSRLDSIQAAVLRIKLRHLDKYNQARKAAAHMYNDLLSGIPEVTTPMEASHCTHVYHQYSLLVERRDELRDYLNEQGIPAMIYYPVPLHMQEAYSEHLRDSVKCPVSEALAKKIISLPIHTELSKEQITFISTSIKQFYNS